MFKLDDINIQGITDEYIDNFKFVETMQFGFHYGYVVLNKILTDDEKEYFLEHGQTINLYPEATFEKLEEDFEQEKTIIYYNQNYALTPLKDGTFSPITTITSSNGVIQKILIDYNVESNVNYVKQVFVGTVTSGRHHFSKLSTILALTNFGQVKIDWSSGSPIFKIRDFEKYLFSLSYEKNVERLISKGALTINEQNTISSLTPDIILNKQNFEIKKHYFFNCVGSYTLLLKNNIFRPYTGYQEYLYNSKTYDLSCLINLSNLDKLLRKWFVSSYHGIIGKIYKEHFHLNVGDAVAFEEYRGLVNTIVRTPFYDEIHFGFPPYEFDAFKDYVLSYKY